MKKQIAIRLEEEDIKKLKIYAAMNDTTMQTLAEECLLRLIKEDKTMKTWQRKGYTVEEREFDYDLLKFVVIQEDEEDQEIVPDSFEVMAEIVHALDNGEDVDGWENGNGETIKIER